METGHTVKSVTRVLARLSDLVREMGELVGSRLERAVRALADRDSDLASEVADRDRRVDEMQVRIRDAADDERRDGRLRRGDTGSFAFAGSGRFPQSGARPQSFSSTLRNAATMRSTPGR